MEPSLVRKEWCQGWGWLVGHTVLRKQEVARGGSGGVNPQGPPLTTLKTYFCQQVSTSKGVATFPNSATSWQITWLTTEMQITRDNSHSNHYSGLCTKPLGGSSFPHPRIVANLPKDLVTLPVPGAETCKSHKTSFNLSATMTVAPAMLTVKHSTQVSPCRHLRSCCTLFTLPNASSLRPSGHPWLVTCPSACGWKVRDTEITVL